MGEAELSDEQPPSPHRRDEVWRQCHLHEIFWWNHDTAKGGRVRKAEKGDPTCMLWMNQTELGCCNVLIKLKLMLQPSCKISLQK